VGDDVSFSVIESDVVDEPLSEEKQEYDHELMKCGFCGKSQHDVKQMIAGKEFSICNECIELCTEIITK